MTRRTRLILILLLGAAVVAGLAWTALRPVPITAELAAVTRGPMEVTVDVDGTTRIREVWEVAAPLSGTALRSPVRPGDRVEADETVVAVVRPGTPPLLDARSRSEAEAAVHEAEAALAVAQSRVREAEQDLAFAEGQLSRVQELVERGMASLVRFEEAQQLRDLKAAARDAAVSGQAMAEGSLERVRAALIGPETPANGSEACCVEIRAPASGVVLAVDRVSERPVSARERLLSLGDPTDLEIVAEPLSREAVALPPGALARVERWGGEGVLEARLRRVEPRAHTEVSALGIEEQRVEAVFDLVGDPAARAGLGDGFAVRLRIVVWESPGTLQVPLGALFRDGEGWAVFRVEDGVAHLAPVEVGQRNDRMAEVLSGLAEGDRVVAHPSDAVGEGVQVVDAVAE